MLVKELLLVESFKNLFTSEEKEKWAEQAFKQLQDTYAAIGGIHGSGFSSVEDFKKNIPFWKLSVKGNKILAAAFYKDRGGRKRVAVSQDGTKEGKAALAQMMIDDLRQGRSYGESSGGSLGFLVKLIGYDEVKKHAIPVKKLASTTGDEVSTPSPDDAEILKHPELAKFFYQRRVGETPHTKIALGRPGNKMF